MQGKSLVLVMTLTIVGTAANLQPSTESIATNTKFKQTYLTGVRILWNCTGKTDYPHISRHVPGTVNVQATIKCPGKDVVVALSLTRISLQGRKTLTRSKSGNGSLTLNAALPCSWKNGPPFRYVASAVYTEATGAHATHVIYRDLFC